MKTVTNLSLWVLFIALMVGNVYVFVSGVQLSEDIHRFETEIKQLEEENTRLETKVLQIESMDFAATVAAELEYTKKADPVFFDQDPKYAYNN